MQCARAALGKSTAKGVKDEIYCICVNMDSEKRTGNSEEKERGNKFYYTRVDNNYRKRGDK